MGWEKIYWWFNSLTPRKCEWNFRHGIFKQILVIDAWGISCEIALKWMSLDFTDDQSTLVQVMAWCHLAASHYLSQCWPRPLLPYGITRPQWVNTLSHWRYCCNSKLVIFKPILVIGFLAFFWEIATELIVSKSVFVPAMAWRFLPNQVLTHIYNAIWCNQA